MAQLNAILKAALLADRAAEPVHHVPADAITTVPLVFHDQFGREREIESGSNVASSNPSLATVALASNGAELVITPEGAGDFTVTYTSASGVVTLMAFVSVMPTQMVSPDIETTTYAPK